MEFGCTPDVGPRKRPLSLALKLPKALLLLASGLASASCGGTSVPVAPDATGAASPATGTPSDWPMYGHDTSRTNYNPGETAISLGTLSRLAPRFRAFVGIGGVPSSSGPIVANGRVYVGSSVLDGNNYFCFDAVTGALRWSANLGHSPAPPSLDVGIGSTAAVSGNVLLVGGGDAAYYALDAETGTLRWRHEMEVGGGAFAWASPLVANGLGYVGMSHLSVAVRGEVRALNLSDGGVAARQYFVPEGRQGADVWNSPTLSPDGRVLIVATGNDYGSYDGAYTRSMVALDPASLAILESRQEAAGGQDLDFATTPVSFHDSAGRVLVGANQKNGVFYAYVLGRMANGAVWERTTGTSVGAMPAYDPDVGAGGTLFIAGDNGLLFGVDPATGVNRWAPVAVGFAHGNMAVANGLVFIAAGNGNVAIVDASTGKILRVLSADQGGEAYSGVVVAGGIVYWMSGPYLNAWGLS